MSHNISSFHTRTNLDAYTGTGFHMAPASSSLEERVDQSFQQFAKQDSSIQEGNTYYSNLMQAGKTVSIVGSFLLTQSALAIMTGGVSTIPLALGSLVFLGNHMHHRISRTVPRESHIDEFIKNNPGLTREQAIQGISLLKELNTFYNDLDHCSDSGMWGPSVEALVSIFGITRAKAISMIEEIKEKQKAGEVAFISYDTWKNGVPVAF